VQRRLLGGCQHVQNQGGGLGQGGQKGSHHKAHKHSTQAASLSEAVAGQLSVRGCAISERNGQRSRQDAALCSARQQPRQLASRSPRPPTVAASREAGVVRRKEVMRKQRRMAAWASTPVWAAAGRCGGRGAEVKGLDACNCPALEQAL
jgi:hypothetical protein